METASEYVSNMRNIWKNNLYHLCVDIRVNIGLSHATGWLTDEIMAPINGTWLFAYFVVKDNPNTLLDI